MEICKKRDWPIGALNVRTDHVHLLLFTKTDVASDTIAQAVKVESNNATA
ncbi:MAG: transposase [Thermoguttaceae bacterium]|nr:transposase [Thermoguttaceae bacterium]